MDYQFIYQKLVVGTHHDFFAGIPSPHKTLGYLALAHFLIRYGLYVTTGSMYFTKTSSDVWWILGHLALSISSFLFPVRKNRNFSNQIIWRELQLHNIVFSARSCAILINHIYFPEATIFSRFCIVMTFHLFADIVSHYYREGTTMRDTSWDGKWVPIVSKPYFDLFYAYSQFGATIVLVVSREFIMEHAFMILFAIQLSTFLMTLRLKGIIDNDMWHLLYTASLLCNYYIGADKPNYHIFFLQVAFFLWRIVWRKNKYVGWAILFFVYDLYLGVIDNMVSSI